MVNLVKLVEKLFFSATIFVYSHIKKLHLSELVI
jgi:hypothetical protein